MYVETGQKNQDIEKDAKFLPEFLSLLSSQPGCCLLSIIVCNTTKVVRSRLKLLEKPF